MDLTESAGESSCATVQVVMKAFADLKETDYESNKWSPYNLRAGATMYDPTQLWSHHTVSGLTVNGATP